MDSLHARAAIRRLLFCVSEFGEQSFGKDNQLSAKRHLLNENKRDTTGRGSAKESASTSTSSSAKGDAEPRS